MTNNNLINNNKPLHPYFVTGLIDGDGSLGVRITPKSTGIGWNVLFIFEIAAADNFANRAMFDAVNLFFGGIGRTISGSKFNTIAFVVTGLHNAVIIRNHLLAYPLLTFKLVYFYLWSAIIDLMLAKAHFTWAGLLKIVAYKAHFKFGLSELLISSFSDFLPIPQPKYNPNLSLINIHWLAGFINADGTFSAVVVKNNNVTIGEQCQLLISISQHNRSIIVLKAIKTFLGFGNLHTMGVEASRVQWGSMRDINLFITRFSEAQLLGAKSLDYLDFCKAVDIVNCKAHLTREGLEAFRDIASGMNSKRVYFGEK
jgi:LAGLIDADG endonuclease